MLPREGEFSYPSSSQDEMVVRDSVPVVIVALLQHTQSYFLLICLPKGGTGLMRDTLSPHNTPKIEQAVENKSSIEEAEVEGAMHHGLRNVKNAIIHRLGGGRGRHFSYH